MLGTLIGVGSAGSRANLFARTLSSLRQTQSRHFRSMHLHTGPLSSSRELVQRRGASRAQGYANQRPQSPIRGFCTHLAGTGGGWSPATARATTPVSCSTRANATASAASSPILFSDFEPGDTLPDDYEHIDPAKSKRRRAGVVFHPTSLPGKYASGEIGDEALKFIDWCVDAGFQVWQVLPLVPPDPKYWSPYSGEDALCGNPLLIPLDGLVHMGLLEKEDVRGLEAPATASSVDFDLAKRQKLPLLVKAASFLLDSDTTEGLRVKTDEFRSRNPWVEESALFSALCNDPSWPVSRRGGTGPRPSATGTRGRSSKSGRSGPTRSRCLSFSSSCSTCSGPASRTMPPHGA